MQFDLSGQVAFITGGGRGIGKAIALILADEGVHIALCGRTAKTLESTAAELRERGVEAWPCVADVSRPEQIEHFTTRSLSASGGRIDFMINNAVSSLSAPFAEQTDEHWRHHIDVKLMAYIRLARAVYPVMRDAGGGRIVNIGGMTARIVATLRNTNGVVNAGVANFTKSFANFVAPHGITVNCVHPGATATDRQMTGLERRAADAGVSVEEMTARAITEIPMGRLIQPEDIARAVLFFCSPLAAIVTGQCLAVDGGSAESVNY